MKHQASKDQVIEISLTLTVDEDLAMDDINTIMDQIVNLIRKSLRKLLKLRHKIHLQPVIIDVISLPLKNHLLDPINSRLLSSPPQNAQFG